MVGELTLIPRSAIPQPRCTNAFACRSAVTDNIVRHAEDSRHISTHNTGSVLFTMGRLPGGVIDTFRDAIVTQVQNSRRLPSRGGSRGTLRSGESSKHAHALLQRL